MLKKFSLTKKELPQSEMELTFSVSVEEFETYREAAVKAVRGGLELPGFRKGNAPEALIVSRYGDMIFLEEMADRAVRDAYLKAIVDEKIDTIGEPEITITKLGKGNPLEFKVKVAVFPELVLPDYKKISKEEMSKEEEVSVSEKEVDDVIDEIRKKRAGVHTHEDGSTHNEKHEEVKEPSVPELTDEFVKTLGKFENVADFKERVTDNLKLEKEARVREKKRVATLDAIQKGTKGDIPEALINSELNRMVGQLKADVASFGGKFEDYLSHVKKTEESLRKEWREEAARRARVQLAVNAIAEKEKLEPKEDEIMKEIAHLRDHYKEADDDLLRGFATQMLQNEKVMVFLEGRKSEEK